MNAQTLLGRRAPRPGSRPPSLPAIRGFMIGFRNLRDVIAGVLQRDERRTAVHRDRFVKCAFPTLAANDASVDLVLKRSKARRAGARSEKEC
jgi:hypothetical protein